MSRRPRRIVRFLAGCQNWRCCWCYQKCTDKKEWSNSITIEHIVPDSLGGSNAIENLAMACARCNTLRMTKPVEEFMEFIERWLPLLVNTPPKKYGVVTKDFIGPRKPSRIYSYVNKIPKIIAVKYDVEQWLRSLAISTEETMFLREQYYKLAE